VKILVTGSSGFIGGSFGRCAAISGHEVIGTSRSTRPDNWPGEYVQCDTTVAEISDTICRFKPDVVLHAAGTASVSASVDDPLADLHGATLSSANVLEGVRRSRSKPLIILPSSAAVFGNPPALPVNEDALLRPISPYGFHKAMTEMLAREYAECFGTTVVVCRLFSVFGPAQRRLLVWELYKQFAGPDPMVWLDGTGTESRDFLYIDDVATALLALSESHQPKDPGDCVVVNVGSGVETEVSTLAKELRKLVAPDKEIRVRGNVRKNDPLHWRADVARLKALLPDWQPRTLTEGLALCVADWRQAARLSKHGS